MPKTIKYTGTQARWPELSVTGKQSAWNPGQQEERSDAEAGLLMPTGLFADVPVVPIVGTAAQAAAFPGLVSGGGIAKTVLLASSAAGLTSGWVASASGPERFALQLVSGTAVVVIDGSNDGSTLAGVILTSTLDTVGAIQSTPISHPYLYIRATHQSGVGVVNLIRGA